MADVTGERPPPQLLKFMIGDWPGLKGEVLVELGGQRTVLVGKNSAGKSLIMAGLARAARAPWTGSTFAESFVSPRSFQCSVLDEGGKPLWFEYRWKPVESMGELEEEAEGLDVVDDGGPILRRRSWSEHCWRDDGTTVWKTEDGAASIGTSDPVPIGSGVSLLAALSNSHFRAAGPPTELGVLRRALWGAKIVSAGVPRSEEARRGEVLVRSVTRAGGRTWAATAPGRVEVLARRLVALHESHVDLYDEFSALALRLELISEGVDVKVYEDPKPGARRAKRDIADVLFDGVNIGLLSDGTLRAAEILLEFVRPQGHLLLIEEPETAVHPGLLSKLLAELEAYSIDRQIVLSTHAPLVVDRCDPHSIRLVERRAGTTTVRSLTPDEVTSVASYLNDEGTLSDFVYHQVDP
jgi:hypothetical protein